MKTADVTVAIVLCVAAAIVLADAAEWTAFRGTPCLMGCAPGTVQPPLQRLWFFKTGDAIRSSPVIGRGKVFVGSDDGSVYALDLMNGSNLWKASTGGAVEAPPLFLDGTLLVGSDDGILYALSGETGNILWTYRTQARITGSANWVGLSNGVRLVVVGSYDGRLHAVNAANGTGVWTYTTGGYVNGTPAVADGLILFGGCDMVLRVLDAVSGTMVRSIEMGSYVPAGPAVVGGRLFVGHFGGDFVCADIQTGKVIWKAEEPAGAIVSYPALSPRRVVYGARDMRVHCLDRMNGTRAWTYTVGGDVDSSPVVVGDRVVFGSDDGRLHVLNLADGAEVWSYEIGQAIKSSPAVADGVVVVGADDGSIYAFGKRTEPRPGIPQTPLF